MPKFKAQAYLAGPNVFYPDTFADADAKKAMAARYGIEAHYPSDVVVPSVLGAKPNAAARRKYIVEENEKLMDECCKQGNVGFIFVNLDAFRGANMDDGTAFEGGYISGLKKHHPNKDNIFVIGYLDQDKRPFAQRLAEHYVAQGKSDELSHDDTFGLRRDTDGLLVDETEYVTTMLEHHVYESTGKICQSFEEACELAQTIAKAR